MDWVRDFYSITDRWWGDTESRVDDTDQHTRIDARCDRRSVERYERRQVDVRAATPGLTWASVASIDRC